MAGFEYMALSRMRAPERMLKQMKEYWGGMIAQGATSFWEGYDANEDEVKQYGFYGRPFGKSLCHAWSSGPAALIPSELLGPPPLSDGWATLRDRPAGSRFDAAARSDYPHPVRRYPGLAAG